MINEAFCAVFHNLTLTHCPAVKANFSRSLCFVFKALFLEGLTNFWGDILCAGGIYILVTPFFLLLQTLSFVQNSTLWKSGCIFSLDASRPSMAKNDSHLSQFIFRKRKKYFTLFFRGRAKNDDSVFLLPATNRLVLWQHLTKSMGSGCACSWHI